MRAPVETAIAVGAQEEDLGVDGKALGRGAHLAQQLLRGAELDGGVPSCGVDLFDACPFQPLEEIGDLLRCGVVVANAGPAKYKSWVC